jgi:hypothetical protein
MEEARYGAPFPIKLYAESGTCILLTNPRRRIGDLPDVDSSVHKTHQFMDKQFRHSHALSPYTNRGITRGKE